LEAFHILAVSHDLDPFDDLPFVVADELESKEEEVLEMQENVRLCTFHEINVIFGQFEGSLFEGKHSWGATDDEAKINVNDVSKVVNKNVVVVTILDLE